MSLGWGGCFYACQRRVVLHLAEAGDWRFAEAGDWRVAEAGACLRH